MERPDTHNLCQRLRSQPEFCDYSSIAKPGMSRTMAKPHTRTPRYTFRSFSACSAQCSLFLAATLAVFPLTTSALTNGLALKPPMGFNPWYRCTGWCNEYFIRACADTIATNGMKDAGYEYINIDDCWFSGRDTNGMLIEQTRNFPSGIRSLADYIHSRGLKFGMYLPARTNGSACVPLVGPGYEAQDAAKLISFGTDFLKYDFVNGRPANVAAMWNALQAAGANMVYSLSGGYFEPWMPEAGNMFRTSRDYYPSDWTNVMRVLDDNDRSAAYAGPGRWNDPDLLHVGPTIEGGSMTLTEYRTHFAMWCIMAAPLIIGADVTEMPESIRSSLVAPELIAIDQDSAGIQGLKLRSINGLELWNKPLGFDGTTKAVALLNRTETNAIMTVSWSEIGLPAGPAFVRDAWARRDLGIFYTDFITNVTAHAAVIVKISSLPPSPQISRLAGSVVIGWPVSASNCILETTPLPTGGPWTSLSENIFNAGSIFVYTNSTEAPSAFYRLSRREN